MIGRASGSPDRSFYCLLGIYAVHAALFHVFCVAPDAGSAAHLNNNNNNNHHHHHHFNADQSNSYNNGNSRFKHNPMMNRTNHNDTAFYKHDDDTLSLDKRDIFTTMPLNHDISRTSRPHRKGECINHSIISYYRFDFNYLNLVLSSWFHWIKDYFSSIHLTSSTWGIISGCTIFLLTGPDCDDFKQKYKTVKK